MSTEPERVEHRVVSRSWRIRLVALAVASLAVVAISRSTATSLTDVAYVDGTAWVSSDISDDVVLASSAAAEISARIEVDERPATIVQAGPDGIFFDPSTATLRVLRGLVLDAVDVPIPAVSDQSFLVSGSGHHRLIDPTTGTVFEIDTASRSAFAVAEFGPVDPHAAVDEAGAVWLTRRSAGMVLSVDERRRAGFAPIVAEPGTPLSLAAGSTVHVLIGGSPGTARRLSGSELGPSMPRCPTAVDPDVPDAAFVIADHIVTASPTEIVVSDAACTTHRVATAVGDGGRTTAVATKSVLAAVSDVTPTVFLVDGLSGELTESQALSGGTRVEVFAKDDIIWFNEVDGILTGTIDNSGDISAIAKVTRVDRPGSVTGDADAVGTGDGGPTDGDGQPPIDEQASGDGTPDGQPQDERVEAERRPDLDERDLTALSVVSNASTTVPTTPTSGAPGPATSDDESPPATLSRAESTTTVSTSSTTTPAPVVDRPETTTSNVLDANDTSDSTTTTQTAAPTETFVTTLDPSVTPPTTPITVFDPERIPSADRPPTSVKPPATVGASVTTTPSSPGASTTEPAASRPNTEPSPNRAPAAATETGVNVPGGTVPADLAPTARIEVRGGRLRTVVGEPLTFIDLSTGSPTSRVWDIGGTRSGTTREITHSWTRADTYRVTLTVRNEVASDTTDVTIVVDPETPRFEPAFTWSPDKRPPVFEVGETMSFIDRTTGHPESWEWNWGDGTTASGQNTVHTWNTPGSYRVVLTVTGRATTAGDATGERISKAVFADITVVDGARPPVAAFDVSSSEVKAGEQLIIGDRSSGEPTSWVWDLGDGTRKTGRSVVHRYEVPNEYTITLTVSNSQGSDPVERTVLVTPADDLPIARIDASSITADVGESISFASAASSEGDSHRWEWGDGQIGSGRQAAHAWNEPGTYAVVLTVENDAGDDRRTSIEIAVNARPDPLEILVNGKPVQDTVDVTVGQGVRFETRGGRNPDVWQWDLGDGRTSSDRSPTHDYDEPGRYVVLANVNDAGRSQTLPITIVVSPPATTTTAAPSTTTTVRPPGTSPPTAGPGGEPAASTLARPEIAFDPIIPVAGRTVTFRDTANVGNARGVWTFPHGTVNSAADGLSVTTTFEQAGVFAVTVSACLPDRPDVCTSRTMDVLVAAP